MNSKLTEVYLKKKKIHFTVAVLVHKKNENEDIPEQDAATFVFCQN